MWSMQNFCHWLLRVAASVTTIILINVGVLDGQAPRTGAEALTVAGGLSGSITAWGDPDLQGIWTNSTITPLERPAKFAGREFMTEEEARALDAEAAVRADQRAPNAAVDVDLAYNQFWWERG